MKPSETLTRTLGQNSFNEIEEAAAAASGAPEEWKNRYSLSHFMSQISGVEPESIMNNFEFYNRDIMDGRGLDEGIGLARTYFDLPDPSSIEKKSPGFLEESGKSLIRGTAAFAGGGISGALSLLGENKRAIEVSESVNRIVESAAPVLETIDKLREVKKDKGVIAQLGTWQWWATTGAEMVPNLVAFIGTGAAAAGTARLLFQSKWLQVGAAALTTGPQVALVQSGSSIGDIQQDAKDAQLPFDLLSSLPEEQRNKLINEGVLKSLETYDAMIKAGGDPVVAGRVASEVFKNTAILSTVLDFVGIGAGKIAVNKLFKGNFRKDIGTSLAAFFASISKEPEQELREEEIVDQAILKNVLKEQVENNILPSRFYQAIVSGDQDKQDIALAAFVMGFGNPAVSLVTDVGRATSLAQAELRLKNGVDKIKNDQELMQDTIIKEAVDKYDQAETFEERAGAMQEASRKVHEQNTDLIIDQLTIEKEERAIFDEETELDTLDSEILRKVTKTDEFDPEATQAIDLESIESKNLEEQEAKRSKIIERVNELDFDDSKVVVVNNIDELPPETRKNAKKALGDKKGEIHGVFSDNTGEVFLISDKITDENIDRVIAHEIAGHQGLNRLFGKERLNKILDQAFSRLSKEQIDPIIEKYGLVKGIENDNQQAKRIAAEEFFANIAADKNPDPTFLNRIIAGIRQALRDLGFTKTFTDNDINVLLSRAREAVRKPSENGQGLESSSENVRLAFTPKDSKDPQPFRDITTTVAADLFTGREVSEEQVQTQLKESGLDENLAKKVLVDALRMKNSLQERVRKSNKDPQAFLRDLEANLERRAKEGFKAGEFAERARNRIKQRIEKKKASKNSVLIKKSNARAKLEKLERDGFSIADEIKKIEIAKPKPKTQKQKKLRKKQNRRQRKIVFLILKIKPELLEKMI